MRPARQRRTPVPGAAGRITATLGRFGLRRKRVAFVLSGGGALGAVQLGMLRALTEAGIRPDLIVGCSVGAINGAAFATDPSLRGVTRTERIWQRLADGDPAVMPSRRLPLAVLLARKGRSLHDPSRLEQLLTEELPIPSIEKLRVPFQCVATDLLTASERWFESGPLVPALMASAALPAVFPSVNVDGRELIDGGVLNEIHTVRAADLGATEIYALHVGHLTDRSVEVQRPFDGAMRAYWTARRYRLQDDLQRTPDGVTLHLLPAGTIPRLRFDDFTRSADLTEMGYQEASRYLASLRGDESPWGGDPWAGRGSGPDPRPPQRRDRNPVDRPGADGPVTTGTAPEPGDGPAPEPAPETGPCLPDRDSVPEARESVGPGVEAGDGTVGRDGPPAGTGR
ncbi:MAG: patatin-like phospholipase family protein [Acidimicrobiales bacterium]